MSVIATIHTVSYLQDVVERTLWIAGQVAIRLRENGFRHKFERYIARDRDNPDLRRKAMTAITAKMARVAHAVVVALPW